MRASNISATPTARQGGADLHVAVRRRRGDKGNVFARHVTMRMTLHLQDRMHAWTKAKSALQSVETGATREFRRGPNRSARAGTS